MAPALLLRAGHAGVFLERGVQVSVVSWIDVKLGCRMLVKHPALTLVGGLGLAVAVALSVGFFSFMRAQIYPVLPLEEGHRIVALENRDVERNNEDRRVLHDFFTWREELQGVSELGAFRHVLRNVTFEGGPPEAMRIAEVTAEGFTVPRVAPLLGRPLVAADEVAGAPDVVVIARDLWQQRFNGASDVLGRTLRIADVPHEIVGVMPAEFGFPESDNLWTPLRVRPEGYARGAGPEIFVFGRLADGVDMAAAQAELATLGERAAAEHPRSNASLRPMVMPYVHSLTDVQGISVWEVATMQGMMSMLLLIVALNVAVLVYARTVARQREIAVRSALGASRGRILAQLFVEALVLAAAASIAGLFIARTGISLADGIMTAEMGGSRPFWVDYRIRADVVLLTVSLAVATAVVTGVVPGLRATRRELQQHLRQVGGMTPALGRVWTGLIIGQVAIAVAGLPAAVGMGLNEMERAATAQTFAADRVLTANLGPDPFLARDAAPPFAVQLNAVMQRMAEERGVAGVSFTGYLPGRTGSVEVEDLASPSSQGGFAVASSGVAPDLLDLIGIATVSGRGFTAADADTAARTVMVNEAFVAQVLGGGSALGKRIRFITDEDDDDGVRTAAPEWFQIVGVARNMSENRAEPSHVRPAVIYPVSPAAVSSVNLAVLMHEGVDEASLAPRLRVHAAAVDPTLRLGQVRTYAWEDGQQQMVARLVGVIVALVLTVVLLLSAAGIYALTSFTVTQRRREIGIRSALGALPRQVLRHVLGRAAFQVGGGIAVGVLIAALAGLMTGGESFFGRGHVVVPALAVLMLCVGVLAAYAPARRGLRIQPTEALRSEG